MKAIYIFAFEIPCRHLEVTKNPYYYLCAEWSQKKVSAHGLMWGNIEKNFEISASRKSAK